MSHRKFWFVGLIVSLSAAVGIGGTSFALMAVGTHRFLTATEGKSLSDSARVRVLDQSMLIPVPVAAAGVLAGAMFACCVPIFLMGTLMHSTSSCRSLGQSD